MTLKHTQSLLDIDPPIIIRNAIQTPDGTILESKHRRDYVEHTDTTDGKWYRVDGGRDYFRGGVSQPRIDLRTTTQDTHEVTREAFTWTSRLDKDLNPIEPVEKKLSELEDNHVLTLVNWTKEDYPMYIHWIICNEAEYRGLI